MIRVPAFLLALSLLSTAAFAEDWGMYQIVSASAPEFVLEVVGGTKAGDVVSIQKPNGSANQKWIFDPKGDGWYWVMPASMPTLTLTVTNDDISGGSSGGRWPMIAPAVRFMGMGGRFNARESARITSSPVFRAGCIACGQAATTGGQIRGNLVYFCPTLIHFTEK